MNQRMIIALLLICSLTASGREYRSREIKDRELKHHHWLGARILSYSPEDTVSDSGKRVTGIGKSLEYGFFISNSVMTSLSSFSFSDSADGQEVDISGLLLEATFFSTPVRWGSKNWKFYYGFGLGRFDLNWNEIPNTVQSSGSSFGITAKTGLIYSIGHYFSMSLELKHLGASVSDTSFSQSFEISDTCAGLGICFFIE